MKIITISDLHGKDIWKNINPDEYDKIIFLGDYVDAPYRNITQVSELDSIYSRALVDPDAGRSNAEIIYNLNQVIEFKNKYSDKVELLLGNHDIPYVYHVKNKAMQRIMMPSGYRFSIENELAKIFNDNIKSFKVAHREGNIMWSHAGITPGAYRNYFKNKIQDNFDIFADELNRAFVLNDVDLFHISFLRKGKSAHGSIFWADRTEWVAEEYTFPFAQIVGHSQVTDITYLYENLMTSIKEYENFKKVVTFTDCLNTKEKFHVVEI